MSAGEVPTARPQNREGAGRPTDGPRIESDGAIGRIAPAPRPERDDTFGTWEPRLRAGQLPSQVESPISWRRAIRESRHAVGIAFALALAGIVIAMVVWQMAEFIDILVR